MRKLFLIFGIMCGLCVVNSYADIIISQTEESPDITISVARATRGNSNASSVSSLKPGEKYSTCRPGCVFARDAAGNIIKPHSCVPGKDSKLSAEDCEGLVTVTIQSAVMHGTPAKPNVSKPMENRRVVPDETFDIIEIEEFDM